jgi:hypothetical protein
MSNEDKIKKLEEEYDILQGRLINPQTNPLEMLSIMKRQTEIERELLKLIDKENS